MPCSFDIVESQRVAVPQQGPEGLPGGLGDGGMGGWTDIVITPHSTRLGPLLGPLPKKPAMQDLVIFFTSFGALKRPLG